MDTHPGHSPAAGLTLLELLLGMTVAAIVAALGIPALHNVASSAQRAAAVSTFAAAARFAHSAALARNATVVLCPTADRTHCTDTPTPGTLWRIGLAGADAGDAAAALRETLRVIELRFAGPIRSNRAAFEFRPYPLRSTNGTVSFCDPRGATAQRAVVISYSGRPRIAVPSGQHGFPVCMEN